MIYMTKHLDHSVVICEHQLVIDNVHRVEIIVKRLFHVKNYFPTYDKIVKFLNNNLFMNRLTSEYMYVIGLSGLTITGILEIGKGSELQTSYSSKDVIRYILLTGAGNFLIVHNHPNADCNPSVADVMNHEKIKSMATIFDLKFGNDLIISGDQYYDMENNCIKNV